jgi:chromosome segregation ATPase
METITKNLQTSTEKLQDSIFDELSLTEDFRNQIIEEILEPYFNRSSTSNSNQDIRNRPDRSDDYDSKQHILSLTNEFMIFANRLNDKDNLVATLYNEVNMIKDQFNNASQHFLQMESRIEQKVMSFSDPINRIHQVIATVREFGDAISNLNIKINEVESRLGSNTQRELNNLGQHVKSLTDVSLVCAKDIEGLSKRFSSMENDRSIRNGIDNVSKEVHNTINILGIHTQALHAHDSELLELRQMLDEKEQKHSGEISSLVRQIERLRQEIQTNRDIENISANKIRELETSMGGLNQNIEKYQYNQQVVSRDYNSKIEELKQTDERRITEKLDVLKSEIIKETREEISAHINQIQALGNEIISKAEASMSNNLQISQSITELQKKFDESNESVSRNISEHIKTLKSELHDLQTTMNNKFELELTQKPNENGSTWLPVSKFTIINDRLTTLEANIDVLRRFLEPTSDLNDMMYQTRIDKYFFKTSEALKTVFDVIAPEKVIVIGPSTDPLPFLFVDDTPNNTIMRHEIMQIEKDLLEDGAKLAQREILV